MAENPNLGLPRVRQLTAQEEIFAQCAVTMSYADAYRIAFNPANMTENWPDPSRVAWRSHVQQRIQELTSQAAKKLKVDREWLLAWWWHRMVYDPGEITRWAVGACRHCHGDDFKRQWRLHEYMDAVDKATAAGDALPDPAGGFGYNASLAPNPECPNCDGKGIGRADFTDTRELSVSARAAFEGIKQTRDGIEIKMADKNVAAVNFAKLSGYDVVQVRMFVDELPEDDKLAELARDGDAIAATYKRFFGPGGLRTAQTAGHA